MSNLVNNFLEAGYKQYSSDIPYTEVLFQKEVKDDSGKRLFHLNATLYRDYYFGEDRYVPKQIKWEVSIFLDEDDTEYFTMERWVNNIDVAENFFKRIFHAVKGVK